MKSLYRGSLVTFLRDVPTTGMQFAAFEWCRRKLERYMGWGLWNDCIAGGFGGILSWMLAYP